MQVFQNAPTVKFATSRALYRRIRSATDTIRFSACAFLIPSAFAVNAMAASAASANTSTPPQATDATAATRSAELSGYMLVPVERAPEEFNAGFSLYAAAWPVVENYPGDRFQTGLFGTWMFPQYDKDDAGKRPRPKDLYTDIEGGLGWWRDTRFATATPKFIMGGVAPNFSAWANGPGAGKGRDWSRPLGKYAVAQLSPWVLWPPDGLNLAQGTCGELFGYGYLPLPIVEPKDSTRGEPVATGDQCWTLFLNTANFKGPVAFFTPFFWSESKLEHPEFIDQLLDTRPSEPNKAFQMETQWVPAAIDGASGTVARAAPMSFPVDAQGRTVVLHRLTCYSGAALTDAARAWFVGGPAPSGAFDAKGTHVQRFGKGGGSTWRLFADGTEKDDRLVIDWRAFGTPVAHDEHTFGYAWNDAFVKRVEHGPARVRLPEYFTLVEKDGGKSQWQPMRLDSAADARKAFDEAGLSQLDFATPPRGEVEPYVTPEEPESSFKRPGSAAGPFKITLGDGSLVTYCWYRFADQPAMLNADLTDAEREEAQRRIELIHRTWTKEREYIAPPTTGALASIDPALLVTPPKGLEIGYVPIVVKQELAGERAPR